MRIYIHISIRLIFYEKLYFNDLLYAYQWVHLYSTCKIVSRKLETKEKFATSLEDGGFSGTSGKQNPNQVCISASENGPDKRNVLQGL